MILKILRVNANAVNASSERPSTLPSRWQARLAVLANKRESWHIAYWNEMQMSDLHLMQSTITSWQRHQCYSNSTIPIHYFQNILKHATQWMEDYVSTSLRWCTTHTRYGTGRETILWGTWQISLKWLVGLLKIVLDQLCFSAVVTSSNAVERCRALAYSRLITKRLVCLNWAFACGNVSCVCQFGFNWSSTYLLCRL